MNDNRARHFEQRGSHEITLAARRWLRMPLIALIGAVACGDSSTVRPAPEDSNEADAGLEPDDAEDGEDNEGDRDAGRDAGTIRRDGGADAAIARSDAGSRSDAGPATRTDASVPAPTTTANPGTASPAATVPPGPTGAGTASAGTASPDTASPGTASPGTASPGTASPGTAGAGTASPDPISAGTASPGIRDPQPGGGNPPATGPGVTAPPPPPGGMTAPPPFCAQRKLQWRVALTVRNNGCVGGTSNGESPSADVNLAEGAKGFGTAAGLSNCIDKSVEPANECSIQLDLDCPTDLGIRGRVTGTVTFASERSFSGTLFARVTSPLTAPCNITVEATGTR